MKTRYGPHELKFINIPIYNQIFNTVYVDNELNVFVTIKYKRTAHESSENRHVETRNIDIHYNPRPTANQPPTSVVVTSASVLLMDGWVAHQLPPWTCRVWVEAFLQP